MCSNFHGFRTLDGVVIESKYTQNNISVSSRTKYINLYQNKGWFNINDFVIYYLSKLNDKVKGKMNH